MISLIDGEIAGSEIVKSASMPSTPNMADNIVSMRFVFDRDFAPFTYEENGSIKGFELDLIQLLGEEMGFGVVPEPMTWKDALLSFNEGDADVIGGLVKTEERLKQHNFTAKPHGTFDLLTFVRADSDIRSASMLQGRKVAGQNGSVSLDLLKNQDGIQVQAYDSEASAFWLSSRETSMPLWAEAPPHGSR